MPRLFVVIVEEQMISKAAGCRSKNIGASPSLNPVRHQSIAQTEVTNRSGVFAMRPYLYCAGSGA
jgi:hypothetical protein